MSVRPVLLKDLRRTAISQHQQGKGKGDHNRFAPLAPRERLISTGKRQLSEVNDAPTPKNPRFDANLVFAQLKDQDASLAEAKVLLSAAASTAEDCCSAKDGAMGSIIHSLLKVMALMLTSHENLTSVIIDSAKLSQSAGLAPPPPNSQTHQGPTGRSAGPPPRKEPPSHEELAKKRLKQSIRDAEKRSVLFNLDLGPVPTMNKETLSRKVTMALSDKAKGGDHDYNIDDAEETIDDVLSCSKLEFLGSNSRKFHNNKNPTDSRNGKFCTLPVRMDFKDKETRIQAEISLRKICKVSCSTPYPKNLRKLLDSLVKEGKTIAPDLYIRTRVNVEKLTIDVHAKDKDIWRDLGLSRQIPLDILDYASIAALGEIEPSTEEEMPEIS